MVFYVEGSKIVLGLRVLVLLLGGGGVVVGAGIVSSSGARGSSTSSSICGLASSSCSVVSGEFADFSTRLPRTYCLPCISMT